MRKLPEAKENLPKTIIETNTHPQKNAGLKIMPVLPSEHEKPHNYKTWVEYSEEFAWIVGEINLNLNAPVVSPKKILKSKSGIDSFISE